MNRFLTASLLAVLVMSSCNTYTGAGAYGGAALGSVFGSAIGGLTGGHRGSDVGTLIGMTSGAIVGAAIGSEADKQQQEAAAARSAARDRSYSQSDVVRLEPQPMVEINNTRFVDENKNERINSEETCKLIFDIYNRCDEDLHDLVPVVEFAQANPNMRISPSEHIDILAPDEGIRYTAMIQSNNKVRRGEVKIRITVEMDGELVSKTYEVTIPTAR